MRTKSCRQPVDIHLPEEHLFGSFLAENGLRAKTELLVEVQKALLVRSTAPVDRSPWQADDSPLSKMEQTFTRLSHVSVKLVRLLALALTAHVLCQRRATIRLADQAPNSIVKPNAYILAAASSGLTKSWTTRLLTTALAEAGETINRIGRPKTSTGLVRSLVANDGKPVLLLWDEFGSAMSHAKSGGLRLAKEVLINAHIPGPYEEILGDRTYRANDLSLSFVGFTITELMAKQFSREDRLSGFLSRMTFFMCPGPDDDGVNDYQRLKLWKVEKELRESGVLDEWARSVVNMSAHQSYTIGDDATELVARRVWGKCRMCGIGHAFAQRYVYEGIKASLWFHVLHGHAGNHLDFEDALRACEWLDSSLEDVHRVSSNGGEHETLARLLQKCHDAFAKLRDKTKFSTSWLRANPLRTFRCDGPVVRFFFEAVLTSYQIPTDERIVVRERLRKLGEEKVEAELSMRRFNKMLERM